MTASTAACAGPSVLTVERGMQVLRSFRSERAPLTNAELVVRTGLSKATVSRLTTTLLQLGFLRHVAGGRAFELAAAPLGIGHAYLGGSDLLPLVEPLLQEMADQLSVSVALAIADGMDMLYVGYRAGRRVATLRLGVGSVLPMGTTAIGHAYLWALPAPLRARLVEELARSAGTQAAAVESGIRRSFDELAHTGTCGVLGGYQRDAYGVALPVAVGRARNVMGLSFGKAGMRLDLVAERRRIDPVLRQAAVRIEALLEGHEGQP